MGEEMKQAADVYAEREKDLYIQTVKGRRFYMSKPAFDIEEIAHATAMQCRYTGHVSDFYSVAEHGVLVSRLVEEVPECAGNPFEGLMHDAHEAYVSDIAAPWKVLIPDYRTMEAKLESAMRANYNLPEKISAGVKRADWLALFIEAAALLPPHSTDDWLTPTEDFRDFMNPIIASGKFKPACLPPIAAKQAFMRRFSDLFMRHTMSIHAAVNEANRASA